MADEPYRIALVGLGKIARDQHIPCIAADPRFVLAATASASGGSVEGVPAFDSLGRLLADGPPVDAVALLTPPGVRPALALEALAAGKHVLLEKPPAATHDGFEAIRRQAERRGLTLFATWHSRFNPAVEEARRLLAGRRIADLRITWKEDVRRWHPGQDWVWLDDGFGVLDPGVNAFSIATAIIDGPLSVRQAALSLPANRAMPIAAEIDFASAAATSGAVLTASLDWRQEGEQTWTIAVVDDGGRRIELTEGGTRLAVDGIEIAAAKPAEYEGVYARFAELLDAGVSDADPAPLRLALDALRLGERTTVDAFDW